MAFQQQADDRLLVAIQGPSALVRVEGRGSFKISPALKEFVLAAIEQKCATVILDMARCVGMDSTFMGVVAGLALRLREQRDGKIIMIHLTPRTRGLLSTLGLDQVVEPYMADATPKSIQHLIPERAALMAALDTREKSRRATAETMLEAHEALVELSPENIPKFKDVLTFLREDLKRTDFDKPMGS